MNLIENKTKFVHTKMTSWGTGVLQKVEEGHMVIEFENAGVKKFPIASINSILKTVGETQQVDYDTQEDSLAETVNENYNFHRGSLIQYDGETSSFAGKNIIEAFVGNDTVIFNESYTIVGEETAALKIHSMYDLTIVGNITVEECVVNGSLTILGTAHIKTLNCYNDCICKGDLFADKVYVGGNMITDSVMCDEIVCDGNVAIQTTANVNKVAEIKKTMFACEGIMGAGKFSALNAIANEYFEFDGVCEGKIVELEIDYTINDTPITKSEIKNNSVQEDSVENLLKLISDKVDKEYNEWILLEEEELLSRLERTSINNNDEIKSLIVTEPLFSKLIDISYKEKIETLEEYMMAVASKKILPSQLFAYESIEHVGKMFLPKAKEEIETLVFEPSSIDEFVKNLYLTIGLKKELKEEWEVLIDKVFESIGIKYSTVKSMIDRNKLKSATTDDKKASLKEEFLSKKLAQEGKSFGLTDAELSRLTALNIITISDFIEASDKSLTKVFGNRAFLAVHLIQVRNKIIDKLTELK